MTAFPKPTSAPSQPQARGETVLHDRRITVDGVETHYLEAGAGPPLLLLHGHEQSATSWRWVIPALARTHRVLALSLPGHGESGPAADGHAPGADLAPFVAAFLFAVGAGAPLNLVGHSAGGAIALRLTLADPARIRTLTLVDSGPGPRGAPAPGAGHPAGHRRAGRHDQPHARRRPGAHHHVRGHAVRAALTDPGRVLHRAARARPPAGPARGLQELANSFCRTDPQIARAFARTTFLSDNRSDLARVTVPTLVLRCSSHAIAPPEVGEFVRAQIPGSRLVTLAATGHCPQLSAPDATLEAIASFAGARAR